MRNYRRKSRNDFEKEKRELWKAVAIAVAGSTGAIRKDVPADWANEVVKSFEGRFVKHMKFPTTVDKPSCQTCLFYQRLNQTSMYSCVNALPCNPLTHNQYVEVS